MNSITTPHLTLIAPDLLTYGMLFLSPGDLGIHLDVSVPYELSEFGVEPFRYTYDKISDDPSEGPWWLYLFIHRDERALVGVGGYKGKPDEQGVVEIGYEIYENYRGQGLATEAAQGLIDWAFLQPGVKIVQAHTLAEENASVQVLRKCGMTLTDAFTDAEDGSLWQWQLKRTVS